MDATTWNPADNGYFRGGGIFFPFPDKSRDACDYDPSESGERPGTGSLQIAEGWTVKLPEEVADKIWKRTDYTWPCTYFAPRCTGRGSLQDCL